MTSPETGPEPTARQGAPTDHTGPPDPAGPTARTGPVPGAATPGEHERPGGYDEDPRQNAGPPPGAYPGPPEHGRGAPGEPAHDPAQQPDATPDRPAIIDPERAERWRAQWEDVRTMFVDQPRDAAVRADGLVGEVLDELARTFTRQRGALDPDALGGEPSTEELRRAVQRYREFFDRLLTL